MKRRRTLRRTARYGRRCIGPSSVFASIISLAATTAFAPAFGEASWEPYCHDGGKFIYDFSGGAPPIMKNLCEASFLGEIPGACRENE